MIKATYVSIWDDEDRVETECLYNPETKDVTEIETAEEPPGANCCTDEYIILPDGSVIGRTYFTIDGNE